MASYHHNTRVRVGDKIPWVYGKKKDSIQINELPPKDDGYNLKQTHRNDSYNTTTIPEYE